MALMLLVKGKDENISNIAVIKAPIKAYLMIFDKSFGFRIIFGKAKNKLPAKLIRTIK